ncbi:carboxypeptidase-like regulatory domain-containing protein [Flaviramulus sp. BrNp1-15]|uniref:carboxypeptidase-like regulatory domain-containing protein n=1 Tax=Flaviramulus sp. BrNp1-15 TaxID=2916754 RepID=UPI001EE99C1D|nr:carboxypeptidase-like regulatory domain-containing protein [Flaviramulus sp. BrNp1-15]ULC60475.1 carboxypeptidase-like regulatory domain-containing protein [Flaviramulus sp. BrNp1-15]
MSSQNVEIQGRVKSNTDIENIHVINKTAQVFTITNKAGHFSITAKEHDTLVFSSVQHQSKEIIITKDIILDKAIFVTLVEQINELDEVLVGKVLTGDLMSDIKNTEGNPPINFYDVGIPGYKGKPATQSERRLHEAGEFKPQMLLGLLGGGLPLNPILNGISGRTKMLKNRVELETREELMQSIKARLSKDFFASNPLDEDLKTDFFYFCADDENFIKHCKNQNDFKILNFLRMKYRQYLENTNQTKN